MENLTYDIDSLGIGGDGTALATLEEANINEAGSLIASTDDETNIAVMTVRKPSS